MKFLLISLLFIFFCHIPLIFPKNASITTPNEIFLRKIENSLTAPEACVICHYFFQRLERLLDLPAQCPDMLDTTYIRQRQREWVPDPGVFSQWKVLFEAKMREDRRKELGLKPDGDHVYYVTAKLCNGTEKNHSKIVNSDDWTFMAENSEKKSKKMLEFTNSDTISPPHDFIGDQESFKKTPKIKGNSSYLENNKEETTKTKGNYDDGGLVQKIKNSININSNNDNFEMNNQNDDSNLKEKIKRLEAEELDYAQTQGFSTNSIQNNNILSFSLNTSQFPSSKPDNDTKNSSHILERKKITFEDIDNRQPEVPQSLSVSHEFSSNDSSFNPNTESNKDSNKFGTDKGNLNITVQVFKNDSKTPQNIVPTKSLAKNSVENKNILDIESSLTLLNALANKTLSSMSSLSPNASPKQPKKNPLDFFQSFRFQDRRQKPVSFLQIPKINNLNSNSINVISNTNIITDLSVSNCSDTPCPTPNNSNASKTHLAYYDVKHPSTRRVIDRNHGTVTTITDLGSVTKTVVMDPSDVDDYLEVEHSLDREFNQSDKSMHYNTEAQNGEYDRPYELGDLIEEAGNVGGNDVMSNETNRTEIGYKYSTKIDVNSPKQFLVSRVQTNNKEGVRVNNRSYEYGKTLNNYTFDDVYSDNPSFIKKKNRSQRNYDDIVANISSKTAITVKEISNITENNEISTDDCCSIEPCHFLKPCVSSHRQENLKRAYVAGAFIQIKEKNVSFLQMQKEKMKLRKRTRFPTPQFDCAMKNVREVIEYLCEQEISSSFRKYCKVIREMIDIVVEGLLYRDSIGTICNNVRMCGE